MWRLCLLLQSSACTHVRPASRSSSNSAVWKSLLASGLRASGSRKAGAQYPRLPRLRPHTYNSQRYTAVSTYTVYDPQRREAMPTTGIPNRAAGWHFGEKDLVTLACCRARLYSSLPAVLCLSTMYMIYIFAPSSPPLASKAVLHHRTDPSDRAYTHQIAQPVSQGLGWRVYILSWRDIMASLWKGSGLFRTVHGAGV